MHSNKFQWKKRWKDIYNVFPTLYTESPTWKIHVFFQGSTAWRAFIIGFIHLPLSWYTSNMFLYNQIKKGSTNVNAALHQILSGQSTCLISTPEFYWLLLWGRTGWGTASRGQTAEVTAAGPISVQLPGMMGTTANQRAAAMCYTAHNHRCSFPHCIPPC